MPAESATLLAELTLEIQSRLSQTTQSRHIIGTALNQIRDKALWKAGEYASFADYIAEATGLSRSSAYRLMGISAAFSAEAVEGKSTEFLRDALTWLKANQLEADDQGLDTPITFPAASAPQPEALVTKRLGDASPSEIKSALTHIRLQTPEKPRSSAPPTAVEVPRAVERRLEKAIGEDRQAGELVSARLDEDGTALLSFRDIPVARLRPFLTTLKRLERWGDDGATP